MQENAEGNAREAELLEVLSAYAEPRAVSFRFVMGFVVVGLFSCASLAWLVAGAPRHEPLRLEPPPVAGFQRGVGAFRAADWHEALRLMRDAQAALDEPLPRVEDFVERLELIMRDEERLARVEQALATGDPERALAVAALIAPNSPLFAQAESLERKARTQLRSSVPIEGEPLQARSAAERTDQPAVPPHRDQGVEAPRQISQEQRGARRVRAEARGPRSGRRVRKEEAGAGRGGRGTRDADRRDQSEAW